MKRSKSLQQALFKIIILVSCVLLVLIYNTSKAMENKWKKTEISFKKISQHSISLQVKASGAKKVQFYLFNAEGKLVRKLETAATSEQVIENPGTGVYLYQCFENDMELKSGKLILEKNELNYN